MGFDTIEIKLFFFILASWAGIAFNAYTKFQGQTTIKGPYVESEHFVPPHESQVLGGHGMADRVKIKIQD